jgi:hypothetical protein
MGVDYHVALHAANWPTMQALQQCIDERGWPVRLGAKGDPRWTEPLAPVPKTLGLPVTFKSEPLELEASFVTLSPSKSFGYRFDRPSDIQADGSAIYQMRPDEALKPIDINETLAQIGASGIRFDYGDRVLSLTFRSSIKEWQAGFYIMAGLIKCFDGYGFELQQGSHGTSGYADTLLSEASELAARK